MTDNLRLALAAGVKSIASYNDGATFEWTPTSCSMDGNCAMNGSTKYVSSNNTYYYTTYAAIAERSDLADNDRSTVIDVNGSICPSGWKLPQNYSINSQKSWGSLTNAYGMTINGANNTTDFIALFEAFPLGFSRTAYLASGSIDYDGMFGYWLSSTYPYALTYGRNGNTDTRTYPQASSINAIRGFPLRCVNI